MDQIKLQSARRDGKGRKCVALLLSVRETEIHCRIRAPTLPSEPAGLDSNQTHWYLSPALPNKANCSYHAETTRQSLALSDESVVLSLGLCTLLADSFRWDKYSAIGAVWRWKCKSDYIICLR